MDDGSPDSMTAGPDDSATGDVARLVAMIGGSLLAFAQPIFAFLVVLARDGGALPEGGSGATDLVTSLFWVQLLTVPVGLVILGWGLRVSRAWQWVLLFLIGIPIVIVVSFYGQLRMCGIVGASC